MFNFSDIIDDLKAGAIEAAKQAGQDFIAQAAGDASAFVESILPSLGRYTTLLLSKQITIDECEDLIFNLRDEAEMAGLTAAGMAAEEIQNTRNAILKAVSSVVIGSVSKLI